MATSRLIFGQEIVCCKDADNDVAFLIQSILMQVKYILCEVCDKLYTKDNKDDQPPLSVFFSDK